MAIGEFTKQLAQQALLNVTKEQPKETPAAPQTENVGATIVAQLNAMQKALKEDEELMVFFHGGAERIRVMEVYLPTWGVAVLSGVSQDRVMARAISPVESLQLVVRVGKTQPGAKASRLSVVTPKS
jgi:hypothetical protein